MNKPTDATCAQIFRALRHELGCKSQLWVEKPQTAVHTKTPHGMKLYVRGTYHECLKRMESDVVLEGYKIAWQ